MKGFIQQRFVVVAAFALAAACGGSSSGASEPAPRHSRAVSSGGSAAAADRTVTATAGAETAAASDAPAARPGYAAPSPAAPSSGVAGRPAADTARRAPHGGGAEAEEAAAPRDGTTVTTTTTTTVTVESDEAAHDPRQAIARQPRIPLLTAASVADVDRRGNYLSFLSRHPHEVRRLGLDMTRRVRFRVVDSFGRPVQDARIELVGQGTRVEGRTHADGYWDFYPGVSAPGLSGRVRARVRTEQLQADTVVDVPAQGDGQDVTIRFDGAAADPAPALDLAFLIDVTGSMGDELRYVNSEIGDIVQRVRSEVPEVSVRVGAVFYRDRHDQPPLQSIDFTHDVGAFASSMRSIRAYGGGDYPEDMNAGLQQALRGLSWRDGQRAVRVMVTIADAPPQRYSTQFDYRTAMMDASKRGIRILPVAASGANREVETLFRAMGAFTSTPYVYLTDDSGIGNPHLEADTDRVAVEYFSDLLTRVVIADLRGDGMHEPGPFGPGGDM